MRGLLPLSVVGSYPLVLESPLFDKVRRVVQERLSTVLNDPSIQLTPHDGLVINAVLDQLTVLSEGTLSEHGEGEWLAGAYKDLGVSVISSGQPALAASRHMSDAIAELMEPFRGERFQTSVQTISKFVVRSWHDVAPSDAIPAAQVVREAVICDTIIRWWRETKCSENLYRFKLAVAGPATFFLSSIVAFPENTRKEGFTAFWTKARKAYEAYLNRLVSLDLSYFDHLQIDEPILASEHAIIELGEGPFEAIRNLSELAEERGIALYLHVCQGLKAKTLSDLCQAPGLRGVALEFAHEMKHHRYERGAVGIRDPVTRKALIQLLSRGGKVFLGCVDVRSRDLDSSRVAETLIGDLNDLNSHVLGLGLGPDCGLRDFSVAVARAKLKTLQEIANVQRRRLLKELWQDNRWAREAPFASTLSDAERLPAVVTNVRGFSRAVEVVERRAKMLYPGIGEKALRIGVSLDSDHTSGIEGLLNQFVRDGKYLAWGFDDQTWLCAYVAARLRRPDAWEPGASGRLEFAEDIAKAVEAAVQAARPKWPWRGTTREAIRAILTTNDSAEEPLSADVAAAGPGGPLLDVAVRLASRLDVGHRRLLDEDVGAGRGREGEAIRAACRVARCVVINTAERCIDVLVDGEDLRRSVHALGPWLSPLAAFLRRDDVKQVLWEHQLALERIRVISGSRDGGYGGGM